jgi:hypothetical protein
MLQRLTATLPLVWLYIVASPGDAQTCSNAAYQGTYYSLIQGVNNGTPHIELDKAVAHGNGGLTFNATANENGAISQSSGSDHYTVNSDCSGTQTPNGAAQPDDAFQLVGGGAGKLLVSLSSNVVLAGKSFRAPVHCSDASLEGAYGFVTDNGPSGAAGFANTGNFVFNGRGNYTYSGYENDTDSSTTISGNGTYSVNADCSGSMSSPPDSKVIALVEGGRVLTMDNDGDFIADTLEPVSNRTVMGQFAFGGGWYSALYFSNDNEYPVSFTVLFIGDDGLPLNVPGVGTSAAENLAAGATAIIEAPNSGQLSQGYVSLALPPGVQAYGVFRQTVPGFPDQEAVAPLASGLTTTAKLTYDETQYITGVTIVNLGPASNAIAVTAVDNTGTVVGTTTLNLPANGKTEAVLSAISGLSGVAGKRGTVTFTASGGNVAALGLRFNGKAFTSIPTTGN